MEHYFATFPIVNGIISFSVLLILLQLFMMNALVNIKLCCASVADNFLLYFIITERNRSAVSSHKEHDQGM